MSGFSVFFNVLILILAFSIYETFAQTKDTITYQVCHSQVIDNQANEPVRVLSMRLPFRISPIAGKHEINVDYRIGNVWNPSGVLEYQNPEEPFPEPAWEDVYHPPYSEAPHRYQFYSADGVIRGSKINYSYKSSLHGEFYTAININQLVDGGSFADFVVSDKVIEKMHHLLVGQDDPFRRSVNGYNRAEMKFTDREGHVFQVKSNQIFLGTWDLGYQHFFEILRSQNLLWTLSLSVQAGVPLNRARQHLSGGGVVGSALTRQITDRYGFTVAIAYTIQHDKLMPIRSRHYDPGYSEVVTGYRILLGQSLDFKKGRRFTIGIEMQGATRPLSSKKRVTAPFINPEDIGVQSSYMPEYWTEENPVGITNQRRTARSLIRGSEYLSLNLSYRFSNSLLSPSIGLYLQEDWTLLYDTEGNFLPLFSISNNSQDFGVGIKLTQPI